MPDTFTGKWCVQWSVSACSRPLPVQRGAREGRRCSQLRTLTAWTPVHSPCPRTAGKTGREVLTQTDTRTHTTTYSVHTHTDRERGHHEYYMHAHMDHKHSNMHALPNMNQHTLPTRPHSSTPTTHILTKCRHPLMAW